MTFILPLNENGVILIAEREVIPAAHKILLQQFVVRTSSSFTISACMFIDDCINIHSICQVVHEDVEVETFGIDDQRLGMIYVMFGKETIEGKTFNLNLFKGMNTLWESGIK